MAKQENLDMEKDKKLLQAILDSLQSDDLWDENIPREKALKEMKEPRYHYMKKNMTISGTKSNEKDTVMAGGDFKKTDAQNMLKDQTGDSVHIKVENPQLVSFRQDLAVLRSGKTSVGKGMGQGQGHSVEDPGEKPYYWLRVDQCMWSLGNYY